MAIGSATVWEARTTGSDTICSGGFNPENANMATDGAATSANTSSPVFSSASYNFVAGDVGAWLFIKSGTNWIPGWYQIASVASNNATLTATIGTGVLYAGAIASTNQANSFVASTVAGCATTASPTGATWSIDYSQQNAAQFAYTDLVSVTTTTITSAALPFGKNCVGNLLKITAGTSWTVQTVEIVSVSTVTATVDVSVGGAGLTAGTGYLGGALKGPQLACAINVAQSLAGNKIFIKSGAYTVSSTTQNGTLGLIRDITAYIYIEGYGSLRGDMGTAPVFTVSGITNVTVVTGNPMVIKNVSINCSSQTGMVGIDLGSATGGTAYRCYVKNTTSGNPGFSAGNLYLCQAESCGVGVQNSKSNFCIAKSCTIGFQSSQLLLHCIAVSCTTGFNSTGSSQNYVFCVAYNSTTGYALSSNTTTLIKCISHTNTTGYKQTANNSQSFYCATYNDGTAQSIATSNGVGWYNFITCTADPFTSVAGSDFSLNNTAGGGALLRGLTQAFPNLITTNTYNDVGAAQHQDSGGGGGGASQQNYICG